MKTRCARRAWTAMLIAVLWFPAMADAARLIVKFRDPPAGETRRAPSALAQSLSQTSGVDLKHRRTLATGAELFDVPGDLDPNVAAELAERIAERADVEYAEPDRIRRVRFTPDDTRFNEQWYLHEPAGGMRVDTAWDTTTGSSAIVVAVVDTGIIKHAELVPGRILPGYDFIKEPFTANDGDERDPDPADPGDWVTAVEIEDNNGPGEPCQDLTAADAEDSSWHGTHVAGIIAATANNAAGIAGIDHQARILPLRVLGKCGGFVSDIAEAILWAVGLPVNGVPPNPNRAKIINASLGGPADICSPTEQAAINAAVAQGAVVVVPSGNGGDDAVGDDLANVPESPAICDNVITVAATDRNGSRANYSNFGGAVEIAAPGGNGGLVNRILSLFNTGLKDPDASPGGDDHAFRAGTSFATANVSGVVALMFAVQPGLSPAQVTQIVRDSGRAITNCGAAECGGGLLDAAAAVARAQGTEPPPPPSGGGGGGALSGWIGLLWFVRRRYQ